MRRAFVDASAWVALLDRADGNHDRAKEYWSSLRQQPIRLLTTDYVLDEAYTFLGKRVSLEAAIALHDLLEKTKAVQAYDVDAEVRQEAWQIFTQRREVFLSFTDCTSFALMGKLGLRQAFTFDADFAPLGFEVVP